MMRNDYRRALILLRCNEAGYSGHVRLERRTLMGSMYFMVQAPPESEGLHALLVGRGKDDYYACGLGQLYRDSRGQWTLSHSFDPRSICARELEQYQLIAVAELSGGDCRIVLYGNVDGHAELNWERVRQAVCLSLNPAPETPSAPQPREEEKEQMENLPNTPAISQALGELEGGETEAQETHAEEMQAAASRQAAANSAEAAEAPERTAAELLGADMSLPWPEEIAELKALFAQSPPLQDAPDDGFVYISTPLPRESPYAFLAVGLRMGSGESAAVRYALPAAYTPEPPAGLEEYTWVGNSNKGWWVSEVELYS